MDQDQVSSLHIMDLELTGKLMAGFLIPRREAGVEIEGHFMIRVIYNDDDTYALVTAASRVLSKS